MGGVMITIGFLVAIGSVIFGYHAGREFGRDPDPYAVTSAEKEFLSKRVMGCLGMVLFGTIGFSVFFIFIGVFK